MVKKHYKKQLNAFVDHELSKNEQQEIAAHLMTCAGCRREHDRIKFGAALASRLPRAEAPDRLWNEIGNTLDGKGAPQMILLPSNAHFGFRNWAGYAVAFVMVTVLVSTVYLALFRADKREARRQVEPQQHNQNTGTAAPEVVVVPADEKQSGSNTVTTPDSNTTPGVQPELASASAWQFETISGTPKVGAASGADRLAVGDFLETDASSRARITVADIGNVEIEPNSRVKLVGTNATEHRLSLELGIMQAKISAPPRLFIVDTPSAVAVDLGCEYKLEVDKAGNSRLQVKTGLVALERGGRESIVLAGAICITKRGKGLGTPFSADTSDDFRTALERFDFSGGGSRAVRSMLDSRGFYDMITLWHLLSRVQKTDREAVFDALSGYVKPPAGVTREGILGLDKKMLTAWRTEVEKVWFD